MSRRLAKGNCAPSAIALKAKVYVPAVVGGVSERTSTRLCPDAKVRGKGPAEPPVSGLHAFTNVPAAMAPAPALGAKVA
jgi:hypothetical protein